MGDSSALGFSHFIAQSDIVARVLLVVLAVMSAISWYLIVSKGIAQVVRQFGIPIEMLDAALSGQPGPAAAPAVDPAQIARQATEQMRREFQQMAAQSAAKQAQARLEKFKANHEAFEDVRDRMADILTARGVTNPSDEDLEGAYSVAVAVDPEWSKVTKQREEAKAATARQAEVQRAKAAAVSIKPNPAVAATRKGPTTLREDLEEAIQQSQRT